MNKKVTIILIAVFNATLLIAQDFNTDQQYKQAMENAKLALSADQYSQAVMFYREALSIKPNELLPKYKIEDIRTIYIKNEIDSLTNQASITVKKKKKKEIELEKKKLEEKAEVIATAKMNQEAEKAIEELKELTITPDILQINDSVIVIEDIEIENTEPDRQIPMNEVQKHKPIKLETNKNLNAGIIKETRIVTANVEQKEEPKEIKKEIIEKPKQKPVAKTLLKPEIDKKWIKKETEKLAIKYPNRKNIEEIDKPGKHITRVIMNIDNKVTIYLKVKHNWGATFYFIDEVGLEPSSISEIHYNRMTDLNSYKNE